MDAKLIYDIINTIVSLSGISFCLTGWIMIFISFTWKISNFSGNTLILTPPNAYLMIGVGFLFFSLSSIYELKWFTFCTQLITSCLTLTIYIVQRKSYRQRLKNEIR